MTLSQKMDVLEQVWESVVAKESRFESPTWHLEILKERESLVRSGKAKFSAWPEAKERIRKRVHASAD